MGWSREFKIGAIMVVTIAAGFLGVQYLKGNDLFSSSRTFYGIYPRTAGLTVGNPVTLSEHQVGQVKRISFYDADQGTLLIEFSVTDKAIRVYTDTKARIQSTDLLGSMSIALFQGTSGTMASNRDTLATTIESGLVDEVNQQIAPIKLKAERLLGSIDSVMVITEQLIREDARPELSKSFASIRKTLESIEHTSDNLDQLLTAEKSTLMKIIENAESITANLEENNDELTNIIGNFSQISDTLAAADLDLVIDNAAESMEVLSQVMKAIDAGDGTLGLLVHSDSLYYNLNRAASNIDALFEDMRVNPGRYVNFSLISRKDRDGFTRKELKQIEKELEKMSENGN